MINDILESNKELREDLFIRGFLVTDNEEIPGQEFPFYGLWKSNKLAGKYNIWTHKLTGIHYVDRENGTFFILGHAYNPFTMEHEEEPILERIGEHYGQEDFIDCINEITGVYVFGLITKDGRLEYIVDPSGMQSACSGVVDGYFYLTSHPQMVADILGLKMDEWVKKLIQYKWYPRVMGPYLPADLTPFSELKRIVPNNWYSYETGSIKHNRFWPLIEQAEASTAEDYNEVISEAAAILRNNMELITKKWERPWISLTGGIDSNTTFAAANGNYDKFETFSYISAEKEIRDAEAARTISEKFKVKNNRFEIPDSNDELEGFDEIRQLLLHNNSYIANPLGNEARKRIVLRREAKCDVEVKSWVSETIRAYWYKHYGRKSMPELSARLYRNLYKIFITNRKLAHEVDDLFEDFIKDYQFDKIPSCYPTADIHFNDVTWGSWGGLNISEMKYCFDITFAYNNRRFFDLMFRVPLDKRIEDTHHLDMKRVLNQELYDMGIRVVNMKETKFRSWALNVIFNLNRVLR